MLTRKEALALLEAAGPAPREVHHALESEAVLRGLAERLGEDPEVWGLTGLLHDLDFPQTRNTPERHGILGAEMLAGKLPQVATDAIRAHNGDLNGHAPQTLLDFALRCGEAVTGLVSANALIRPTGMAGMKPKSLKKKMKSRAFAANVSRETIRECERLGLDLGEFFQISIDAITPLAAEVGLGPAEE
jgi:putative nucleotidyltransferase with HDIG domain